LHYLIEDNPQKPKPQKGDKMEKPSLEKIKELVSFKKDQNGEWAVNHVYGNVHGHVHRNVYGHVGGNVHCHVGGSVNGSVCGQVDGSIGSKKWRKV